MLLESPWLTPRCRGFCAVLARRQPGVGPASAQRRPACSRYSRGRLCFGSSRSHVPDPLPKTLSLSEPTVTLQISLFAFPVRACLLFVCLVTRAYAGTKPHTGDLGNSGPFAFRPEAAASERHGMELGEPCRPPLTDRFSRSWIAPSAACWLYHPSVSIST